MKKTSFMAILLSACLVFSGCGSLNNTAKGGMIGGGSGAALGALIGGIAVMVRELLSVLLWAQLWEQELVS